MRTLTLSVTILLMVISTLQLTAQRNCASKDMMQLEQDDPKHAQRLQAIENHTLNYIQNQSEHKSAAAVVTIPIVFHVIYNGAAENISDAELMSQLQVLNDDFRRLNSDADGTWSQAADTEIQFCLATVDPNGNATTGITRTSTTVSGFGTNDAMKFSSQGGKDAWPRNDYLNFWVCNIGGGILGYAQFPGGSAATDGVVNDYRYTGTIGSSAPFNLGRTATHEVGHWLNLRHIWGDGNCNADDFVTDTPTSDAANYGCASTHVSCSSTDMVQNYMDYSDDGCMNLYTEGQKARMQALFAPGGARVSLLSSGGCGAAAEPTCDDGLQNGNETGVDCGGSCNECPPEPTCDDGTQNGDETGVDCGGSCGNVCPCDGNAVVISITLDNYPEETSWSVTNANGATVASGGTYGSQADGSTVTENLCLPDACYTFTINDTYGDGICCSYGSGSYSVTGENGTLASGGQFTSSEATDFCFDSGPPAPTCTDGVQNGDEEGVDCGGSCAPCQAEPTCDDGEQNGDEEGVDCGGSCAPCATCSDGVQNGDEEGVDCGGSCPDTCGGGGCTYVTINSNNFDSNWGIWNDGGSDCRRSANDAAYANSGTRCVRLRDNTSTSTMTTDNLDLSGYDELTVEFSYIARSMDNANEDFWLQISTDGGASFTTVEEWNTGDEFVNNQRNNGVAVIAGTFSATTKLRIRCDASGNSDWIYIDDVVISGCTDGNNRGEEEIPAFTEEEITKVSISSMNLFPNPANSYLNVEYTTTDMADVQLYVIDMTGKVVEQRLMNETIGEQRVQLDINQLSSGFYFVQLISGDTARSMKFVKP